MRTWNSRGAVFVVVLAAAMPGCGSDTTQTGTGEPTGGGPGSTGDGSTSGTPGNPISPGALGDALYILSTDTRNVAIGGTVCGAYDMTIDCPTGGTVAITGSSQDCPTAGGSASENESYTFTMTDCQDVADGIDIKLNGTAQRSGNNVYQNGVELMETMNFQATSDVKIDATESGFDDFSQSCTFAATYDMGSSGKTLTGTVCGTSFTDMF